MRGTPQGGRCLGSLYGKTLHIHLQRYSTFKLSESRITRMTRMTRICRYSLSETSWEFEEFSRELNASVFYS